MLEAIGFIILWIFRILLIVFSLVLISIIALLFIPLRYDSEGEFCEEVNLKIHCTWLCKIFRFTYSIQGSLKEYKLKVLFWQIYPKKKPSPRKKKAKKVKKEVVEKPVTIDPEEPLEPEDPDYSKKDDQTGEASSIGDSIDEVLKDKESKEKVGTFSDQIRPQIDKVKGFYAFLQEKENDHVISFLLKMIKKMLLALFPRKARARLVVGLEDPATTGYLAAFTSVIYVKSAAKVHIIPDFEQKIIQGTYKIKGRVYLYQLIYYIMKVVLDQRVKRLIKMAKGK